MKKTSLFFLAFLTITPYMVHSQTKVSTNTTMTKNTFPVTLEKPVYGSIQVTPTIPENGQVPEGAILSITTTPAAGYALDAIYYYTPGEGPWRLYHEVMQPEYKLTVNKEKVIGASFIEKKTLDGFSVIQNVEYAQPGQKKLKYDVYSPDKAHNLPIIIIIHGGGWFANTEDIMRGMAREMAKTGKYVVCSVDYRFIGHGDGDAEPNSMADLIDDVYGAINHIREHAEEYGGDPSRIALTGDSAGGHLSAAAANMVEMIGDNGFGTKDSVFEYLPTYIPEGKSVDQIRTELAGAIKAVAPSYGVFSAKNLSRFTGDKPESWAKAIAPIDHIPPASERQVPQFLLRGTNDMLIRDQDVRAYADALRDAGQTAEYVQVEGAGHAFFDWKPDSTTKATFAKYGVPNVARMIAFFDGVFYPGK